MRRRYKGNLRAAVGSSAAPYGYTLATWTSGAVLINAQGIPTAPEALLFMFGAVLGFATVGAFAFGSPRAYFGNESRNTVLWGNFHFLSVGLAIGAASLAAYGTPSPLAWPVTGLLFTSVYLLGVAVELTASGGPHQDD